MTPVDVAARWLTDEIPEAHEAGWDRPTIVDGVWWQHSVPDAEPIVWRPTRFDTEGYRAIIPDAKGRYRVTCDDGVRRRLTLDELRGVA